MSETIEGLEDFEAKLKALEFAVQKESLIAAVKAGAEIIRAEAEARAPRRTGTLAEEEMITVVESTAFEVVAKIGPSKEAFYGLFQELGTAHMTAHPFLLPAAEDKKQEALDAAGKVLKDKIEGLAK
jgi:HK97 gp10 family phage protein